MVGSTFAGRVVAVAAACVVGVGGVIAISTGAPSVVAPPTPNAANLFIDSNGGSCTFHPTPVAYSVADGLGTGDATSCASTGAAYTAANSASASASTVAVRAGSYGDQDIPGSSRTGGYITFVETNGDVTFTNAFEMHGDKTQWVGMTTSKNLSVVSAPTGDTSTVVDVVFDGWSARGSGTSCTTTCDAALFFKGVNGLMYKNGDICCGWATTGLDTKAIQNLGGDASNVTLDHVNVHDWGRPDINVHTECALLEGINGLTIRNTHWWNCPVFNISLARVGGSEPDPANTLIENNIFERPDGCCTIGDRGGSYMISLAHVTTRFEGLIIRNNTVDGSLQLFDDGEPGCPCDTPVGAYSDTHVYSNIFSGASGAGNPGRCRTPLNAVAEWNGNVLDFTDTTGCGSFTAAASPLGMLVNPLVAGGAGDWHLKSGVAAIGAASQTSGQYTTTDLCGFTRTSLFDAGAYEFGTSC